MEPKKKMSIISGHEARSPDRTGHPDSAVRKLSGKKSTTPSPHTPSHTLTRPHTPTTEKKNDSPSLDWKNLKKGASVLASGERFNKLRSISTPLSSVIEFDDAIMVLLLTTGELSPLSPASIVNIEQIVTDEPSHRGYPG